jgi:hypothetical protein
MEPMTRTERRKSRRQAKKEQGQKQRKKELKATALQKALFYLVTIIVVGGLGYWAYAQWIVGLPGEFVPSLGNQHISQNEAGLRTYNSDPPTSGPHFPMVARWGVHEIPIPKELQVHNLEDGGVVVQYSCDPKSADCKTLVDRLAEIIGRYEHTVLAPYPGMGHKIALTAWTRIEKFDELDEQRIVRFIDAYHGIDHHPKK